MEFSGGSPKADHLCVLVHGLWGNPNHLNNVAKTLRAQYSPDELYILLAKRNSGSFTYDGIECGGERVCAEIEEEMRSVEEKGGKIKKLSIVGYSLGGLVSRYAIGLLHAKGILDTVECRNFATFATPHLGVRSPLKGWHNHVFNVLGARTLSMSGKQLFTVDKFRDTGRPLLAVLADPKSIFMTGLRKFKRHTLYANVVNDRSVTYFTASINKTDPYSDIENLQINYLDGWDNVLLNPEHPFDQKRRIPNPATLSSVTDSSVKWVKRVPFILTLSFFLPIGVVAFLVNSVIQTSRSSSRIKLHEKGEGGIKTDEYRVPLWIKEMREEVEHVYETLNNSQNQEYLAPGSDDDASSEEDNAKTEQQTRIKRERRMSVPTQPTLALAPCQFEMIDELNSLDWRKYPVHIQKIGHSHAAIIVRTDKETFSEGHVVLGHFAKEEFLL